MSTGVGKVEVVGELEESSFHCSTEVKRLIRVGSERIGDGEAGTVTTVMPSSNFVVILPTTLKANTVT